ncbi:MAG: hypothetical protein QGH15_18390, partial [Kiritimatiellia bacterium]|nr:hypothetical protein [Kiritimatiellia bacterium]
PATQTEAHKGIHRDQAPSCAGSHTGEAGVDHPATSAPSGAVDLNDPPHGVADSNRSRTPESPAGRGEE